MFFFLLLAATSLSSKNYEIIENCCNLKILTPSLKNQETAKIKLNNGLIVYIVSDPEIKESAAAMALNVGSWNDPEEYPGMAHFMEHMLFQGTTLYPARNDFFRYVSDLGGLFNAFTGPDKTVYMFSVNNDSFIDGLKRFSQFFISPLFDPSAIGSELIAVDQEHAKNIENDMRRLSQVWKETSNIKHPHHQFATGNSSTLSKIPRESLIKWHSEYYRAGEMKLVIYSPNSIDSLITTISDLFQAIPSGDTKRELVLPELSSSLQKGQLIYIKPIKDIQEILLQWELPKELVDDDSKSTELVAYAINVADKSSLLNELKKENLVDDLLASASKIGKHSIFLDITLTLTDEGIANRAKVIQKCFEKIENLKENSIPPFLFNDLNTMSRINYEYQTRNDAFSYVNNTAVAILEEDISSYPQKTLQATSYNVKKIKKVLNCLTPDTCQAFILAPPGKTGVIPNKKEEWIGVEYSIEPLPFALSKALSNIKPNPNLENPRPNPFIPSNLSILSDEFLLKEENFSPLKIFNSEYGIGYFISQNFNSPEINWIFKIKTPVFDLSYRSFVLLDLFSKSLIDNLTDIISQARIAGLYANIKIGEDALIFQIKGYSEKAPLLLDKTLKKMKSLNLSKDQFDTYVKLFEQDYGNSKFNLPVQQASEELSSVLNKNLPSNEERLKILRTITFEEQKEFQSSVFEKTFFECIFTGNQSIKSCETIWQNIQSTLSPSPYEKIEDNVKILSLHEGPFLIEKKTDAMGCGIILAIDENPFSFKNMAAQDILAQSIKEPFFSEMRSKQKIAYFTNASNLEKRKHLFQLFAVQSGNISAHELLYRFEIFINSYIDNIEQNIDRERFNKIKENIIIQLKIPPKNIDELAIKYTNLAYLYKDFDFEEKRIKATSEISYEDFLGLARQFLNRNNKKRLAILVEGKLNENSNIAYKTISSKEVVNSFEYTPALFLEDSMQ